MTAQTTYPMVFNPDSDIPTQSSFCHPTRYTVSDCTVLSKHSIKVCEGTTQTVTTRERTDPIVATQLSGGVKELVTQVGRDRVHTTASICSPHPRQVGGHTADKHPLAPLLVDASCKPLVQATV